MPDLFPEGLTAAMSIPGAGWVLGVTFLAGIIYGFAGFGAALIYMPIATVFIAPPLAVGAFAISAITSLVTVVPRALGQCEGPAVLQLILAALLAMPVGLYALGNWDITLLRWCVVAVTGGTLGLLILGWRRAAGARLWSRLGIGGAAGLVGGATGLVGPIVVLFQLASADGAARGRSNTIVFLTFTSLLTLPLMWMQGILGTEALWLGALMLLPYGAGTLVGQAMFDPGNEALYRRVAYTVIAAAIVVGLPIWES